MSEIKQTAMTVKADDRSSLHSLALPPDVAATVTIAANTLPSMFSAASSCPPPETTTQVDKEATQLQDLYAAFEKFKALIDELPSPALSFATKEAATAAEAGGTITARSSEDTGGNTDNDNNNNDKNSNRCNESCETELSVVDTSEHGSALLRGEEEAIDDLAAPLKPNEDAPSPRCKKSVTWNILDIQSTASTNSTTTSATTTSTASSSPPTPPQASDSSVSFFMPPSKLAEKISQPKRPGSVDPELHASQSTSNRRGLANYLSTTQDKTATTSKSERSCFSNVSASHRSINGDGRRKIRFTIVEIREMPTILGRAPVTLGGPSITMSWTVQRTSFHKISEMERSRRRNGQCSWQQSFRRLTAKERIELMHHECGYSLQEINQASKMSQLFHQQRLETRLLNLLETMQGQQHTKPVGASPSPPTTLPPAPPLSMDEPRSKQEELQHPNNLQMNAEGSPPQRPGAGDGSICRVLVAGRGGRQAAASTTPRQQQKQQLQLTVVQQFQQQVEYRFQKEQHKQQQLEKRFKQIQQQQRLVDHRSPSYDQEGRYPSVSNSIIYRETTASTTSHELKPFLQQPQDDDHARHQRTTIAHPVGKNKSGQETATTMSIHRRKTKN